MFNNILGFDGKVEFLPKDFDEFNCIERHRRLFLSLLNNITKDFCFFSKYEQNLLSKYSLEKAFEYKIKSLLPSSNIFINQKSLISKEFKFCKNSTIIINNYLNNKIHNSLLNMEKYSLKVAKLISNCYFENRLKIFIDKHILFHEFVLKKIKKLHSDKNVFDLGDSICIKSKEIYGIKIYTSWKNIIVDNPDIKDELDSAIKSIKKKEFYQIYLAYPKNEKFKKHIPIYVDELKNENYQIKAIPYSLRSIIK